MADDPKTWPRGWAIAAIAAAFIGGRWSANDLAPSSQPVAPAAFVSQAAEDTTGSEDAVAALDTQDDEPDGTADSSATEDTVVEPVAYEEPERDVYYANCSEARAAGAAPVMVGEPGYAPHLDRDHDGIGCE